MRNVSGSLLAIFAATSGHSGVDRVLRNLISEFAARGLRVDLLHVRNHGPHLETIPPTVRVVELGTSHVNTSLFALIRYLRREKPAALLTDKDRVNRIALLARWLSGVATHVAVRMGTTVSANLARRGPLDRWIQLASIRMLYRWADAVLVPSQGAADDLARVANLAHHRITVVPSPVVTPQLMSDSNLEVSHPWLTHKDQPVILGVGELGSRKDFATLVRAFARLRAKRKCRLIILGRGKQHDKLMELAKNLGVADDVSFPGFVANPYAYMAKADLFVLSSVCEGSPVVLMEALATGTPVVSTDCPSGPREILQNGKYGALVTIGDDVALAEAMYTTLQNPPSKDSLRSAVRPFAIKESATSYLAALGFASS